MPKVIIQVLTILFALLPINQIFAAEFIASVMDRNVRAGQSFVLNLALKDAKAKGAPELSILRPDFTVYSQQQYSTFSSVNGNVTSEAGWDIMLIPNKDGDIIIPAIAIKTDQGMLQTAPIQLIVSRAAPSKPQPHNSGVTSKNNAGISLVASTNKAQPFVKEPIIYTLKIISYKNLINLTLEDIKASDAIIDKIGQPKQYEQNIGGTRALVIELKYHVTPLVPGKITILPAVIRGEMQSIAQRQTYGYGFGMMHSPFFDPVGSLEPFEVHGDKLIINVMQPPINDPNWLPLQKLVLTQEWEGVNGTKVGDTIIRKIKLVGTGTFSNQLPSLKEYVEIPGVKLYADTPILSDNPTKNNAEIVGSKEEVFTLVPTAAGQITFPAITIGWWNLQTKRMETASLPAKTIDILPSLAKHGRDATLDFSEGTPKIIEEKSVQEAGTINNIFYLVIGVLLLIIVVMLGTILYLVLRKRSVNAKINTPIDSKIVIKSTSINDVDELRMQIIAHAKQYWAIDNLITTSGLGAELDLRNYKYSKELLMQLSTQLNTALYAGISTDLVELTELWHEFKLSVTKTKTTKSKQKMHQDELNPT